MKIVLTGFRDKKLEQKIQEEGGEVVGTVSKNTKCVIAQNPHESSTKLVKARDLQIEILSVEEFNSKYLL